MAPSSSWATFRHFSPGTAPLNFRPNDTADSKIIVTEGYEAMYHRIVNIREDLPGREAHCSLGSRALAPFYTEHVYTRSV